MDFLLIVFVVLLVYWVAILIYHKVTKISYVKEVYVRSFYRDILFGGVIAAIGILSGVFAYNTHCYGSWFGSWVLMVFPLGIGIFALIVADLLVKKHNWKKYTLSKFTEGTVYDWEVRSASEGFIFGLIYWDRKISEQCSWAYMEADEKEIRQLQPGKVRKVKFSSNYCFPKLNGFTGNLVVEA